eukprot:758524-Hanusia_phi.AAC.4
MAVNGCKRVVAVVGKVGQEPGGEGGDAPVGAREGSDEICNDDGVDEDADVEEGGGGGGGLLLN